MWHLIFMLALGLLAVPNASAQTVNQVITVSLDLDGVLLARSPVPLKPSADTVFISEMGAWYRINRPAIRSLEKRAKDPHFRFVVFSAGDDRRNRELLSAIHLEGDPKENLLSSGIIQEVYSRKNLIPADARADEARPLELQTMTHPKLEDRGYKDLRIISGDLDFVFHIDNDPRYVTDGQQSQWIHVKSFAPSMTGRGLEGAFNEISRRTMPARAMTETEQRQARYGAPITAAEYNLIAIVAERLLQKYPADKCILVNLGASGTPFAAYIEEKIAHFGTAAEKNNYLVHLPLSNLQKERPLNETALRNVGELFHHFIPMNDQVAGRELVIIDFILFDNIFPRITKLVQDYLRYFGRDPKVSTQSLVDLINETNLSEREKHLLVGDLYYELYKPYRPFAKFEAGSSGLPPKGVYYADLRRQMSAFMLLPQAESCRALLGP